MMEKLSPREVEVMQLVADGHTAQEIGKLLGIVEQTAKNYKTEAKGKLGAQNIVHAVVILMRSGVLK